MVSLESSWSFCRARLKIKALDISEDLKSNLEIDSQELTDKYIKKVDEMFNLKEKDILTL